MCEEGMSRLGSARFEAPRGFPGGVLALGSGDGPERDTRYLLRRERWSMEAGSWPEQRVLREENMSKSPVFKCTLPWRWASRKSRRRHTWTDPEGGRTAGVPRDLNVGLAQGSGRRENTAGQSHGQGLRKAIGFGTGDLRGTVSSMAWKEPDYRKLRMSWQ